ncbi:MAG: DUF4097 domain-containing protein [Clostridiales bacterium]|nr:DUF4097 domain-containing protein [Clostridiales bacterium]
MKPTSIIFLIVAVILAIGGFTTMRIAESLAKQEGIELVVDTHDDDEDYVFKYEYDADSIGKIALNIKDAKVNVIGGADKPYIELVNFPEGMYEFSSANRILTVSNNSDLSSLSNIANMAMNFKGLRSLVNYRNINDRDKTVNIYLCDDYPVKIVECKLGNGNVQIEKNSTQTDYNIEIGKGHLSIADVKTTSLFNISIEEGDVLLENCTADGMTLKLENGSIDIVTSAFTKITSELENGNFNYGYHYNIAYVNLDLFTGVGSIRLDGDNKGGYYTTEQLPTSSLYKITLNSGDIVINSNMTPNISE